MGEPLAKRKEKFLRGAFARIATQVEQQRLDRALEWLRRLVRQVPVEHRTGLRYPDKLADSLEHLSVAYPFPEDCPIYLLKPRSVDHRTERQAMDVEIATVREASGGLRLVCLWDLWDKVRPPQETHGLVSMIDEWTDWRRANFLAEQGEVKMGMSKHVPDRQHQKHVWAAALLVYKYGYPAEELLAVADRGGREMYLKYVTKRRQFIQHLRLPHLWSPDYFSTFLLAAKHEDPEAFAREIAYFKKQAKQNN